MIDNISDNLIVHINSCKSVSRRRITANALPGIVYASVPLTVGLSRDLELSQAHHRLDDTVASMLRAVTESETAAVLWRLKYTQRHRQSPGSAQMSRSSGNVRTLPTASLGVEFDDSIIELVQSVWEEIIGHDTKDQDFMVFEDREGVGDWDEEKEEG